ncbi:MAG: hypothetical protein R2941_19065 [Desulfobacterales bacterium]
MANTDIQALEMSRAPHKIQSQDKLTEGLGAGANPQVGREAAMESAVHTQCPQGQPHGVYHSRIWRRHRNRSRSVVADICKELGALTVAVGRLNPFFEGKKKYAG